MRFAPTRRRDPHSLCIVESARDVTTFERAGNYRGLYHVLGGRLAPLDGIGPEQLHLNELNHRVKTGEVREVILATSPTLEGDGTALYINNMLAGLGVSVTQLARGLPTGSSLDLVNPQMLADALDGRHNFITCSTVCHANPSTEDSRMSRIGFDMRQELKQSQIIAPRMIQSMEILQLPVMALLEKIEQEMEENPFLETKENRNTDDNEGGHDDVDFNPDAPMKHDETGDLEFARMDEINRDWGDHFNEEHRPSRMAAEEYSDRKLDAMMNIASTPQTLQDHLTEQLPYLGLNPDQKELTELIISHLDDNGYLLNHDPDTGRPIPIDLEELAQSYYRLITIDDIEEALLAVQGLDPCWRRCPRY